MSIHRRVRYTASSILGPVLTTSSRAIMISALFCQNHWHKGTRDILRGISYEQDSTTVEKLIRNATKEKKIKHWITRETFSIWLHLTAHTSLI